MLATTSSTGLLFLPSPVVSTPRSLTSNCYNYKEFAVDYIPTTLAPLDANSKAYSRPNPKTNTKHVSRALNQTSTSTSNYSNSTIEPQQGHTGSLHE